jgi:hypothetical protein
MRLRHLPIIFAFALSGCGGEGGFLSIAIARSGLAPDVTSARITLHAKDRTCDGILSSGPERRASYTENISISGDRGDGVINEVRPGTYTVAVWSFNTEMTVRGFGCRESVLVEDGEMAEVDIVIQEI